jgi:hypothetical protein
MFNHREHRGHRDKLTVFAKSFSVFLSVFCDE